MLENKIKICQKKGTVMQKISYKDIMLANINISHC